jgi:hypothetical protein
VGNSSLVSQVQISRQSRWEGQNIDPRIEINAIFSCLRKCCWCPPLGRRNGCCGSSICPHGEGRAGNLEKNLSRYFPRKGCGLSGNSTGRSSVPPSLRHEQRLQCCGKRGEGGPGGWGMHLRRSPGGKSSAGFLRSLYQIAVLSFLSYSIAGSPHDLSRLLCR